MGRVHFMLNVVLAALATTLLGGCSAFMQGFAEGMAGSSAPGSSNSGSSHADASTASTQDYSDIAFDVSPDSTRIVFAARGTDNYRDLYFLNVKTLRVTVVAKTVKEEADPAFSNDGKALLYDAGDATTPGNYIYYRSLDGKRVKRLTSTPNRSDAMPSYSPDGSHIVFVRGHRYTAEPEDGYGWSDWDVYIMRKDGSQLRRITRRNYPSISAPHFNHDGTTIFYSADTNAKKSMWKVFSIKLGRGHKPEELTAARRGASYYAAGSNPNLSPDHKHLVFISDRTRPYEYELYTADLNGAAQKRISWHHGYASNPVYTRDARQIYYLLDTGYSQQFELWRCDANGKNAHRIADKRLFSQPLQWRNK